MSYQEYPVFTTGEPTCADPKHEPEWWFDYTVKRQHIKHSYLSLYAKELCKECPVMQECRTYALQFFNLHGVWGATDMNERKVLQKKLGIEPVDFSYTFASTIRPNIKERVNE